MKARFFTVALFVCCAGTIVAVVKNKGTSSGITASSTSTIKVTNNLSVTNANVTMAANAKFEGLATLNNSSVASGGGTKVTIKSGTVTNGKAAIVTNSETKFDGGKIEQAAKFYGKSSISGSLTSAAVDEGISLEDSNAELDVAMVSSLPTSITMNGGKLNLKGTTKLADGKSILGTGTVNCDKNSLVFGATPVTLSSKLKIKKGADIQFNNTLSVAETLLFDGDAAICGNGNILDLSGGVIAIRPYTNIHMTNLILKGLGSGEIVFYDQTSTLSLSNVQVAMNSNYTVTTGGVYVQGPTTVATANYLLNFSLNSSLTVDGVSLMYDTLGYPDNQNICPAPGSDVSHKNVTLLNNGVIRNAAGRVSSVGNVLDGTSNVLVMNNNYVFHKGNAGVAGSVRFGGGFTILADTSAVFDTFVTVSGPIDLRETGTLILIDDLQLGSNVTLSSGGNVDARGHALKLSGNLAIPNNKILHVMSNATIDGQGHTLTVGDYGQLFVDNNVTLTLQNMVLKSGAKTRVFPPFRCAGLQSKIVLNNLLFQSGGDIPFYQGQLAFNNDVVFGGTSALVYKSSQASTIFPGATLMFDHGTTFSYAPCSTSKDLIQLQDVTSRIVLDGCCLKCTDTGLRLTVGSLLCDNKVNFDSMAALYLSSLTTGSGWQYSWGDSPGFIPCAWRPDGKFWAIGSDYEPANVKILSFDGTNLSLIANVQYGNRIFCMSWSPDGRYLAVGGGNGDATVKVYSFDGTSLTLAASRFFGIYIWGYAWSPDGRYLAAIGAGATDTGFGTGNT
ncbi:MAG: WD40 repeat domain-containing protein, partial [Candidatus Babeliales bacterium]